MDSYSATSGEREFYQPITEETWEAYQALITLVNNQLGSHQPEIIQCVVANEVLEILKDKTIKNCMKKQMLDSSLNEISDDTFDMLLFIGEHITDFNDDDGSEHVNTGIDVVENDYPDHQLDPIQFLRQMVEEFQIECGGEMEVDDVNGVTDDDDEDVPESRSQSDPTVDGLNGVEEFSSEEYLTKPLTDDSASSKGIKLEYSSEEEIMYFDFDQIRLSDKEDEEDWVKIEYGDDGIYDLMDDDQ